MWLKLLKILQKCHKTRTIFQIKLQIVVLTILIIIITIIQDKEILTILIDKYNNNCNNNKIPKKRPILCTLQVNNSKKIKKALIYLDKLL